MALFADHGDRPILINLANATDSGIGSHAPADDEILMMFHVFSPFLMRMYQVGAIKQISLNDSTCLNALEIDEMQKNELFLLSGTKMPDEL
jgi:hypothetical protein